MRIVVTGHDGYIGTVLVPMLTEAGHDVVGIDSMLYEGCGLEKQPYAPPTVIRKDVRDITPDDFEGADAVAHLASISNDPVGDLNPGTTEAVNTHGTKLVAEAAKTAGVSRFVFMSSCSLYGAAKGGGMLDESSPFNPVTPYGVSKVDGEALLSAMADDDFSPVHLRNATVYGVSPRLRGDLVVNNLTAHAVASGTILLKSDGSPWRPLVHVQDVSRAVKVALEADREKVHDEPFNVGRTESNHQIREVATMVGEIVQDAEVSFATGAGPDTRDYKVDCSKLLDVLPEAAPQWTVPDGIAELAEAYRTVGLQDGEIETARYRRIHRVRELIAEGRLDESLVRLDEGEAAA